jgi:hypothetical protein
MFGNMSIMTVSHSSFFSANSPVIAVNIMRLTTTHLAICYFVIDPPILIVQALIYFSTAGMPGSEAAILRHRYIRDAKKSNKQCRE